MFLHDDGPMNRPPGGSGEDRYHVAEVAPGLWRVSGAGHGGHRVLVLVTSEGTVVVDPATPGVATWIAAWARRHFDVSVRHVVYTHAHFDHIGGGGVLADMGAEVWAHRRAVEPITGERLPTAAPTRVVDREAVLELGGEELRLTWLGPSHSNSMMVVEFPRQGLLLATDFCPVGRVPFSDLPDFYYDGWMESLAWIQDRQPRLVDGGHWELGTVADVEVQIAYMTHLHREVLRLVRAGQSWDELYRNVGFDESFQQLAGFSEHRFANILGMYRWVSQHRRGAY